jgi:LysM repeat protein/ribosomal protein L40E
MARNMTEPAQDPQTQRRVCPTCGSRVSLEATRCVVCGTELRAGSGVGRAAAGRRGRQVNLPLPLALGILAAFTVLAAGIALVVGRLVDTGGGAPTPTSTQTPTPTNTAEPTATETPAPTWTPLPPIQITLAPNFYCVDLAAYFNVSLQSILDLNPGMRCEVLNVGQSILIPQPTRTATPEPTGTLSPEDATAAACETVTYSVQENDVLSAIAENYNVSMQAIMDYNTLANSNVFVGQVLIIPLCRRNPTPGPSPTPTPPPPYPAPNLLLPQDGMAFTLADDSVSLQWASVAQLRENEFYMVTVEDITEGSGTQRVVAYATDTKYIVPASFRPTEALPHVMRWWVTTVRQTGTNTAGNPVYASAGATSARRDFTWSGAAVGPTPTP